MYAYPPYAPQAVPHEFLKAGWTHLLDTGLGIWVLGEKTGGAQNCVIGGGRSSNNAAGMKGIKWRCQQFSLDNIDGGLNAVGISDRRAAHCLDLVVQLRAASASQHCFSSLLCFSKDLRARRASVGLGFLGFLG